MRRPRLNGILLFVALAWLAGGATPAQACSPTATPEGAPTATRITIEARAASAAVIFEGTVVGHENGAQYGPAIVRVERYLKGRGPDLVLIVSFGSGPDCMPVAMIGNHGLFYTSGDPYNQLYLSLGSTVELSGPAPQATIATLVGYEPVPPAGTHPVLATTDWSTKTPEPPMFREPPLDADTMRQPVTSDAPTERPQWAMLALAAVAFVFGLSLALWAALRKNTSS